MEDVAGTAYRLALVSTCLSSLSTGAPHWRGADASAAAAQIGVVASLADELSGGVSAAAHRLRTHHDRLIQDPARDRRAPRSSRTRTSPSPGDGCRGSRTTSWSP